MVRWWVLGGSMDRRRAVGIVSALTILLAVVPVATASAPQRATAAPGGVAPGFPAPERSLSLKLDKPIFWHSETAVSTTTPAANVALGVTRNFLPQAAETCGGPKDPVNPCWTYGLRVPDGTGRLGVAIDMNRRGDCWQLELWAPDTYGLGGQPKKFIALCPEVFQGWQLWNGEAEVFPDKGHDSVEPGEWVVRVVPFFVEDWGFRLRAVASKVRPPTGARTLSNLEAHPPYEFGFQAPANPNAGTAVDKHNGQTDPRRSCTDGEREEAAASGTKLERCLRFSAGMYNTGRGDLELLLLPDFSVVQRIRRDDGNVEADVPAGTWEHHAAHDHAHYVGFANYELYRVETSTSGRRSQSVPIFVGVGNKAGWNPADQRYADWSRVDQGPSIFSTSSSATRCYNDGHQPDRPQYECITQENGWGDHYRWQRPGNYVDFTHEKDGDFVVRMVVDHEEQVVESDEHDNAAYAWIRVEGETVTVCERGYGDSPWDPRKRVSEPGFWQDRTTADPPAAGCSG